MARDFGAFYYSAWNDHDFRTLPDPAQALYMRLVVHPSLSWAGVGDWRPGRIATMSQGLDGDGVRHVAQCLIARRFIVVDEDTEEFLIRTYIKHDGIVRHAKLCISMAKAFGDIGSNTIRMVVSDELHKLRRLQPDATAWTKDQVLALLDTPRLDARSMDAPEDPFSSGFSYGFSNPFSSVFSSPQIKTSGSAKESVLQCPTPAPAPAPLAPAPRAIVQSAPDRLGDDEEKDEGFETWWRSYPKHTAKDACRIAYLEAITDVGPDDLLEATREYVAELDAPRYAAKPLEFLTDQRWLDFTGATEPDPWETYPEIPPADPIEEPRP